MDDNYLSKVSMIISAHNEESIIEKNKCGILVNPLDSASVARDIIALQENPKLLKEMGNNGYSVVLKEFNWKTQEKYLFDVYQNALLT